MAHRRIGPFTKLVSFAAFQIAGGADQKSIELNGTNEYLRTTQNDTKLGPSNAWTTTFWWRPDIAEANDYAVYINGAAGDDVNAIKLYSQSATSLRIKVYDSAGVSRKTYTYGTGIVDQVWQQHSLTWDGTTLVLYRDGVELTPTVNQDEACTQTDDLYEVAIGATITGAATAKILAAHSLGMWDEALTSGECLAIFNGGDGSTFDYGQDSGGYSSSANLVHWWRLGMDVGDIGEDSVAGSSINLMDNAVNITSADIVDEYPQAAGGDDKSIELDGTSEYLRTTQNATKLGPNNAWTIAFWWKPDIVGANDYAFYIVGDTGSNENAIKMYSQGSTSMRFDLYDSASVLRKRFNYGSGFLDQTWQLHTITFDGTDMEIYRDGVDMMTLGMVKSQDAACTQNDDLYEVAIGATTGGAAPAKILAAHSMGMWDEAITSGECLAIYNGGDGTNFDLASDSGGYTSSANLIRWWRLGLDSGDIGLDSVDGDVDLMDNALGITAADIVDDSPT